MRQLLKLDQNTFGYDRLRVKLKVEILDMYIQRAKYVFVDEHFLSKVIEEHGAHSVSTYVGTWYPSQACRFLKIDHHIHFSYEKNIIEIIMQYIKDRIKI